MLSLLKIIILEISQYYGVFTPLFSSDLPQLWRNLHDNKFRWNVSPNFIQMLFIEIRWYISEESKNVSTFISLNQFGETIKNAVNSSIG